MIVAIESCPEGIVTELNNFGYNIVDFYNHSGAVDAIIYTGHLSNTFSNSITSSDNNGIFVINAEGKSATEIDNILQKRLYSPIFFF